ncbi:SMP-30/gluconolactonase/LRE family protein [Pseudomaricurvus alkylphenolicus]|uniref:SMP-30/gluconolactonase/LRE family protein n=1 Tax=Pseudomaricurvus alkylphenolicus TaxID=1306991 RepID=UPI001423343B|nr:SMP-30/gluconolactonase/LRE family protein [Pseudomaricurvus alkylphenolicus]NIB44196.1 SMP-30/gluconolactonase/LRE family protein [Pseudomaricurvus alkylphenolicus]
MEQYSGEKLGSIEVGNHLGEGIIWHARDGAVWWTDIQESKLYRYHLATEQRQDWSLPERLGCFGFFEGVPEDKLIMAAFASGVARYDLDTGELDWIARPELDKPGLRFNDGRVDRQGRFWAGSMIESDDSYHQGGLYRLNPDLSLSSVVDGITISNGLCWSPDSRVMYHSDSPRQEIYAYDFEPESGSISNRRLFAKTEVGCYPDGATVDAEGFLWSAQWGGSKLVRYAPDGQKVGELPLPVSQPTCLTFGGNDLATMFITSARENLTDAQLAEQPEAGNVLIYRLGMKGIADPLVR